jgi:hypothetical protein
MYKIYHDHVTLTALVYTQWGDVPDRDVPLEEAVPLLTPQEAMANVRSERNKRLVESDWTQLPDVNLSAAKKAQWAVYRQALRDITDNFEWNVTKWPEMP